MKQIATASVKPARTSIYRLRASFPSLGRIGKMDMLAVVIVVAVIALALAAFFVMKPEH